MTDYIYQGPFQGLTLHDPAGAVLVEVVLHPGKPVSLPADHSHVVTLVAAGWLQPEPTRKAKATAPTTQED